MPTPPKMPMANQFNDNDELIFFQGGRQRRLNRQQMVGNIEQRLQAVEQGNGQSQLAQRLGSLEEWRQNKAPAIPNVNTDAMATELLGISVGRGASVTTLGNTVNTILGALRQREIISA